jgi:hypothetical protein
VFLAFGLLNLATVSLEKSREAWREAMNQDNQTTADILGGLRPTIISMTQCAKVNSISVAGHSV